MVRGRRYFSGEMYTFGVAGSSALKQLLCATYARRIVMITHLFILFLVDGI